MKFNIITRCSRINNLEIISRTIFKDGFNIDWHIIFDTNSLKDIPADLLKRLQNKNTFFHFAESNGNDYLYPQAGELASTFNEGYIVLVDDDNIVHKDFYERVSNSMDEDNPVIYVINQIVDGRDFTGLDIREAKQQNMKYQGVDAAQLIFHHSFFKKYKFDGHYAGDGLLIDKIIATDPSCFVFIRENLCYYNYLESKSKPKLPRVLLINNKEVDLKSYKAADYEDNSLDVLTVENDNNIEQLITIFNPDSIVAVSDDWRNFPNLANQPLQIRNKWITIPEINDWSGESAYHCAMTNMLNNDNSQLISYFTPIYNTGKILYRTYESLKNQTYDNWEWVLVNDSSDGGRTLKIAEEIAKNDPRVKVYDFREKSNGIIGEVKYRAANLCRGYLLAELDHDDYLVSNCTELLYNASQQHPEIGFFYTDSAEIDENYNSLTYPQGFAFGYGKYEKITVDGREYNSCISANINPKTIRHIVGVPNHVRAWRRDIYQKIGGHNRDLSIADDYELIVRTFLETKMMRIPTLGYLQFIHSSNSHDLSRADIQRRVRTIMYHYNERIAKRFEELGVEDYCYNENPQQPLWVESRFGSKENFVNEIYSL